MRAFASVGVASSSNYRLIDDSSECNFLDNRCEWLMKSCDARVMSARPNNANDRKAYILNIVFQAVDRIGTTDGSLCENCDFLKGESYATEVRLRRLGSDLCPCSLPVYPRPSDGRRYESQL
jgi:hypothetical protein